ncbi:MAG: hypothetical protein WBY44_30035 [Bryobacteraceae bacterium]
MPTSRRQFLFQTTAALAARAEAEGHPETPQFRCDNPKLQKVYDAAVSGLKSNVQEVFRFPHPVLLEGATYAGVWLECAPLEGLVYAPLSPETALANHEVFFDLQRDDGYLPCNVKKDRLGTGQIQMVVPIAATAWDLYLQNRNTAFLEKAYRACSRWDAWLVRYRNTRGTGLCEAFCTYDTGHDNSPRFLGKSRQCPDADARVCPKDDGLPYLAPDLSATVYGGRVALAAMAREMNRGAEAARWLESADSIRKLILDRLYDSRDGAFYDIDSHNKFVRVRGDLITRVMGEHVVDQKLFEDVWRRQLHNPAAFWRPYPFPSVASDDPSFVRPIPRNSWGGASQALTALRTPRWMERYGKQTEFAHLMTQWVSALVRSGEFLQQMDPDTGEFSPDRGAYSPAMLTLFDFTWRLYGVRPEGNTFEWNCRLPEGAAAVTATWGPAKLETDANGSTLTLAGKRVAHFREMGRVVTTRAGKRL